MDTISNSDEWLDAADPCDAAHVAALVEVVEGEREFSGYKAIRANNGCLIVTALGVDQALILHSKAAEAAFVRRIHGRYVPDGMHAGIYAAIEHQMARD